MGIARGAGAVHRPLESDRGALQERADHCRVRFAQRAGGYQIQTAVAGLGRAHHHRRADRGPGTHLLHRAHQRDRRRLERRRRTKFLHGERQEYGIRVSFLQALSLHSPGRIVGGFRGRGHHLSRRKTGRRRMVPPRLEDHHVRQSQASRGKHRLDLLRRQALQDHRRKSRRGSTHPGLRPQFWEGLLRRSGHRGAE